jgi:hypothetical protein
MGGSSAEVAFVIEYIDIDYEERRTPQNPQNNSFGLFARYSRSVTS